MKIEVRNISKIKVAKDEILFVAPGKPISAAHVERIMAAFLKFGISTIVDSTGVSYKFKAIKKDDN